MTQQMSQRKLQKELEEKSLQLERASDELAREIAERERAEEAERALLHTLGERIKELNCLYGMSRLVETHGISLEEILQGTVDLIPPAWQYPEITCARIVLDGQEFRTENYRESRWKQTADIHVHGKYSGVVEVTYLQAKPQRDDASLGEGPFLREERDLLDAIAEQLGNTIERVRAEKELVAANARLERRNEEILEQKDLLDGLLQHSPLAVVINDLEQRIVVANPAFRALFGYPQDEILGANLDDLLSTPETVQEMRQLTNVTLVEPVNTEGKRKRKDGTLADVEILSVPFFVRGEQFGYLVFYHDLSDRRDVEANLERTQRTYTAILDTLEDPYFEADPLGVLIYINSAFCRWLGYEREEVIGQHFRRFVDQRTFREVMGLFRKLYETKQSIKRYEGHYRRRDGKVLVAEWSVSPVLRGDDVVGSRGVIRDITPRVRAETALREARDEAEARAEELAAINRVAALVNRSLDLDDILQPVCLELVRIFPVRNAGIALLDPEGFNLEIVAFHSIDPNEDSAQGRFLPLEGNPKAQDMIDAMETVVISDAQTDPRTRPIHDLSRARGSRSYIVVPLVTRGEPMGAIGMPAKDLDHVFTEHGIELAETIANQIAGAIERARLYRAAERQSAGLAALQTAYYEADLRGTMLFVTDTFCDLIGYAREEIVGSPFSKLTDELTARRVFLDFNKVYETGKSAGQLEYWFMHQDGSKLFGELSVALMYDESGQPSGFRGLVLDVTQRRQAEQALHRSEEKYRTILEDIEEGYYETDLEGNLVEFNDVILDITERSGEELLGSNFAEIADEDTASQLSSTYENLFRTREPVRNLAYTYTTAHGATKALEASASVIEGEDGEVTGFRGVIRDITERQRQADRMATLYRVGLATRGSLDIESVLVTIYEQCRRVMRADVFYVALLDVDTEEVTYPVFFDKGQRMELFRLPLDTGFAGWIIQNQRPFRCDDTVAEADQLPIKMYRTGGQLARSYVGVPLWRRENVIGVLSAQSYQAGAFKDVDVQLLTTLATQAAVAIENARLYAQAETARDVAERELEIGREIQSGFFPEHMPAIEGFEVVAHFQAARQVAGDFYDLFRIDDSGLYGVVIADVCDKGVGAALFMVLVRSLVRSFSEQYQHFGQVDEFLNDIVSRLNNYIAQTHGRSNMFATMFLGILDPVTNVLWYVNGGHEPPVVINTRGDVTDRLSPTGPAVGLMPDLPFGVESLNFDPGDLLIAYTDGIPEARDMAGDFYTEERLLQQCSQAWPSAFSVVKQLEADVFDHIGEVQQFDDVTLIALRRRLPEQRSRHHFSLKAELPNLPLLRGFVVEACQMMAIDEEATGALKLAVDEACANLILHGYQGMEPGDICLSIEHLGGSVQVQIEDSGVAFDPDFAAPPDLEAEVPDRDLGGLGVFFIKEMVDELGYEGSDGINRLTLIKNL